MIIILEEQIPSGFFFTNLTQYIVVLLTPSISLFLCFLSGLQDSILFRTPFVSLKNKKGQAQRKNEHTQEKKKEKDEDGGSFVMMMIANDDDHFSIAYLLTVPLRIVAHSKCD